MKAIEILMIEDNPGDVELVKYALEENKFINNLTVAENGQKAVDILQKKGEYASSVKPDLILLDLNLPILNGREVLSIIKNSPDLRSIPVVVLTSSDLDKDIKEVYELYANCYITKPIDLNKFVEIVHNIESFWFSIVKLPEMSN